MKTLILVRHAKSSWDYPELDDLERPLNKRGKRDAPRMGQWLRENFFGTTDTGNSATPDLSRTLILTSHSVRTLSTISKLGHAIGLKGKDYKVDERLYHANTHTLWQIVRSAPTDIDTLMLIGHNPGLTEFAQELCPQQASSNIPTCGVFALNLNISSWAYARAEAASFRFFQYPKNL